MARAGFTERTESRTALNPYGVGVLTNAEARGIKIDLPDGHKRVKRSG